MCRGGANLPELLTAKLYQYGESLQLICGGHEIQVEELMKSGKAVTLTKSCNDCQLKIRTIKDVE